MFKRNWVPNAFWLKNIYISLSSLPPCHSEGPRPAAPVLCTSVWPRNLQQVSHGHHHLYPPELTLPVYISPWAAIIRANPKSQSLMTPVLDTRMFSGFISRWMICRQRETLVELETNEVKSCTMTEKCLLSSAFSCWKWLLLLSHLRFY